MKNYIRLIGKVFNKTSPEHLIFFVTSKCNFNCKMCFYKNSLGQNKNELNIDEIERISKNMPHFHWLQISGGETFLRDDLDEICGLFARNNQVRFFNIPTNGFFSEKIIETTEKILKNNPKSFFNIGVSVLGLRDIHEGITGIKGSFDRAITTYFKLFDLKKQYRNLGLSFPVNQNIYNEKGIKPLFDFLMKECKAEQIGFNLARGENVAHKYTTTSPQLYLENWNYLLELASNRNNYYFQIPLKKLFYSIHMLQKDMTYETARYNRFIIPCYAARISGVIDETGNIFSCEMRKTPLGNLRKSNYDFCAIWNSERAKEERRQIKNSRCFCTHECFMTTNIIFNPAVYPRLIKKWIGYKNEKNKL